MHPSKTILIAIGLAALAATPTLAQPRVHARAQQPAVFAGTIVVAPNGRVIGADPDPNVRAEMLRDYPTAEGAN